MKSQQSSSTKRGGRGAAVSRHADANSVNVIVDPKRKKRFDDLIASMRAAERDEASGFDAYWEAVGEILDAELYVYGGHDTQDAFLAREVKMPRRSALRMVRVARYASPIEEARYGTAVLDAAIGYIEAKTGGPTNGKLPVKFDELRVPVVRDGKTSRLSLDQATYDEVTAATRALVKGTSKERPAKSPAQEALVKALRDASLSSVSVHVSDGEVRFGAVPLLALEEFARVLRTTALPTLVKEKTAGTKGASAETKKAKKTR